MFYDFLNELEEKEIQISFSNGKLQYTGREQNIDEKLIANLVKFKPQLVNHFWPRECKNMFPVNTEGDLTPLVLLHGGSISEISPYLEKGRPFYSFMHLGTEDQKTRYKSVESFANEYLKQFQIIFPKGKYVLGGMSLGGHLAYEIAIQLQHQGYQIPLLIIVDSRLIAYDPSEYFIQTHKRIIYRIRLMLKEVYRRLKSAFDYIRYEIFTTFYDKLTVNKKMSYVVRTYYQILRHYKPVTEFKGKILLFRASQNDCNSIYLGWEKVCKNITIIQFKGNHSEMFGKPEIVGLIKTHIAEFLKKNKI